MSPLVLIAISLTAITIIWVVTVVWSRPVDAEHDLRRRALRLLASLVGIPTAASALACPAVAVAVVIVWAVVTALGLHWILRAPRPGPPNQ